ELTHAAADHVDSHDRPVVLAHDLHGAAGAEDLAPAVAGEVVVVRRDVFRAELLLSLRLSETHRGNLRLAVSDLRNVRVVDDDRLEPGDLFGDKDALLEAAVRQLKAGDDITHGIDTLDVRREPLVCEHETAIHLDAGILVAEVL